MKNKISFVWDWDDYTPQTITWKDGLARAIQILSQKYEVQFLTCGKRNYIVPHEYFDINVSTNIKADVASFNPDVILMWGDATRPNAEPLSDLGIPMALCFAGGQPDGPTMKYFDHFFVESEAYKQRFDLMGKSCSIAFGTNTELFKTEGKQQKVFDVCFPATYAAWKRHHIFAKATAGLKVITCGYVIPAEKSCMEYVQASGGFCLPHVSPEALKAVYEASKCCFISSHWSGGSQRTALEAMAMDVPLVVMPDSDKCMEFVQKSGEGFISPMYEEKFGVGLDCSKITETIKKAMDSKVNTRDWVLNNYSEYIYADNLEKGLLCLI